MLTDPGFVDLTMRRTVEAMVAMNYSGVKFDGCGPANNLTRWAELINASGHRTALSGSISTVLTGLSWICVGIHSRRALPSPVCA